MNSEEHRGSLGKAVVAALTCNASTLRQEDSWELETNQNCIEKNLFQKQQQQKFFLKKVKGNFGDVSYVFMLLTATTSWLFHTWLNDKNTHLY